jgi:hypothetical protein
MMQPLPDNRFFIPAQLAILLAPARWRWVSTFFSAGRPVWMCRPRA